MDKLGRAFDDATEAGVPAKSPDSDWQRWPGNTSRAALHLAVDPHNARRLLGAWRYHDGPSDG